MNKINVKQYVRLLKKKPLTVDISNLIVTKQASGVSLNNLNSSSLTYWHLDWWAPRHLAVCGCCRRLVF